MRREDFQKALEYAKEKPIWINIDIPDYRTVRGSSLQRTLLSIRRGVENLGAWYGVFVAFRCYSSHKCPICGGRVQECRTTRTRIVTCHTCNFQEERDQVPFYWWLKEGLGLPLPRPPRLPKPDQEARS